MIKRIARYVVNLGYDRFGVVLSILTAVSVIGMLLTLSKSPINDLLWTLSWSGTVAGVAGLLEIDRLWNWLEKKSEE